MSQHDILTWLFGKPCATFALDCEQDSLRTERPQESTGPHLSPAQLINQAFSSLNWQETFSWDSPFQGRFQIAHHFSCLVSTGGRYFGEAFQRYNCEYSRVSLAPSADVLEFLEEVVSTYPKVLADFDYGQLKAYKNQVAFDKRNAAVEDGKENSSSPLEGLGSSKREALIVAVPQGIFL